MFDWLVNLSGKLVGYAEMIGLKYPVKEYRFQVAEGLWRGSRLDMKAIRDLKEKGFQLIVNLCAENDNDSKPAAYWKMKAVHIPIMDNQPPQEDQMVQFLNLVLDPKNQPAYVHCEAGKGRTGVAIACYRVVQDGWSAVDAIAEADKFGLGMPSQEQFISKFSFDWKSGRIFKEDGIISIKKMI